MIDLGTCGIGDPACDLVIAWTFLRGAEREISREAVALPAETWSRARGWALWKALITMWDPGGPASTAAATPSDRAVGYAGQAHALEQLLAELLDG